MPPARRAPAPAPPTDPAVDLTDCEREPVHTPGGIQPHGLLLALDAEDLTVRIASDNAAARLGVADAIVLGRPLTDLVTGIDTEQLRRVTGQPQNRFANPLHLSATGGGRADPTAFTGVAHWNHGLLVLELEPRVGHLPDGVTHPEDAGPATDPLFQVVQRPLAAAVTARHVEDLAEVTCRELRRFTGFDRTMVYRFAEDDSGEVIGESVAQGVDSFLGLRYPASDIPPQARALYLRQWLRQIVDVNAAPAAVLPALHPHTGQPLDLGHAALRAVSPVHLQYLRNMGVGASLAVSLIHEGRLWGMLICHHRTPRFIPYTMRSACELLGTAMSSQFVVRENTTRRTAREQRRSLIGPLLQTLTAPGRAIEVLQAAQPRLPELLKADGTAVVDGVEVHCHGMTPPPGRVAALLDRFTLDPVARSFATDCITETLGGNARAPAPPELDGVEQDVAGVMIIELRPGVRVAAFRQPVTRTVRWGGDPTKPAFASPDGTTRLAPRSSFAEWVQTVRHRAEPWTELDREVAEEFRTGITALVLRRTEELLRLKTAAENTRTDLTVTEAKLQLAFEGANLGFWEYWPADGTTRGVGWLRPLGYTDADVEPDFDTFFNHVHPDDRERVRTSFEDFLRGAAPEYRVQLRMRHREGRYAWIESRGTIVLRDHHGSPTRVVGLHVDIDNLKASQQKLLDANDEMQSFIYAVSHDLKSPLVTCQGFVDMLREDLQAGDQKLIDSDLNRISEATADMSAVVDDLLELGRLGRGGIRRTALNLGELVQNALRDVDGLLKESGGEVREPDAYPPLRADRHAVRRILQNLIENAARYGCAEDRKLIITVDAERSGEGVLLSVADNGNGIEPQYHQRIFRIFERLGRDQPGTGVGLASVAKAAELHGGRAWVDSAPGRGARFYVMLPDAG